MNDANSERLASLLAEIRDNQRLQLERDAESLAVARESLALTKQVVERQGPMLDRAEAMQAKAARIATYGRRILTFALVILVVLLALIAWEKLRGPTVVDIDTRHSPR